MYRQTPHRLFLLTVLAASIAVFFFGALHAAKAADPEPETTPEQEIVIQIQIPGVTFSCSQHPGKMCVRSLGEYISGFYRFFAGALGIIAAVMVMWGGMKWSTAGGNTSKVADAKDTIYSALIALLITLGSYILLFTINPKLVSLDLPTLKTVQRIEQGSYKCSENTFSTIDLRSGCDPERQECCGQKMKVNLGPGEVGECVWDICNQRNQFCWLNTYEGAIEGVPPSQSGCVAIQKETLMQEREWCTRLDGLVKSAKTNEGNQKFQYTGVSFRERSWEFGPFGGETACVWNVLLDKYFTLFPALPPALADFQPQFIGCYTQGAKGECWDLVDGTPQPLNCGGNKATPCMDPRSVPRPVAGAAGACLVKNGRTGSPNKEDYKCWSVPKQEIENGWGSPLSY